MPKPTSRPRRLRPNPSAARRTASRAAGKRPAAGFDPFSEERIDGIVSEWDSVVPGQDSDAREIAAVVMRISMLLQKDTQQVLTRYRLLDTEFRLLGGLRRAGAPYCHSPSELSPRYVPVTSGGMSGLISRMARRGLVRRRGHPSDGRGVLVELTPEGRELIEEVMAAVARREALMVVQLKPPQRRTAARLLRSLLRAANASLGTNPFG